MSSEFNTKIDFLVDQIKPILAGHHPGLQGAVIADLLAMYIAGLTKENGVRAEVFDAWFALARDLVTMYGGLNSPKKNSKKNKENPRKK